MGILTSLAVERIKPDPTKRVEMPDGGLPGFYLVVQPSGQKSWAVRYRHGGKPRKLTLGPYPALDLRTARDMARAALTSALQGGDPAAEKIARRRVASALSDRDLFENIAAEFIERYAKANTRESTWREAKRILEGDAGMTWARRRVQTIARRDVVELLDSVVDRGAPVMAGRTLAVVRRMFGWLVERGVIEANPCAGVKAPVAQRFRDRVLSDTELRLAWRAGAALGFPNAGLVHLLILTGQRLREVAEMTDREVDIPARTWTIPRERAKNDVAHQVPLSDQALAVLSASPRVASNAGFVFTTTGRTPVSGFSKAKERLDAEMLRLAREDDPAAETPHWTLHDLRRTAATGMARLGINLPVIEKVLNHVSGSFGGIVGVYQRHGYADEKRAALEAWGRHVATLTDGGGG